MSKRLQQTALSLVAVVGAFFAYRVVAVPFIEPSAVVRETKATSAELNSALGADTRNAELLNRIFPPGAWQRNDPIVLESDQALLLMKEYRNLDTGEVELNPFTMVFFPNGDQSLDETLLRRVIVLQAPQGAILKFDEPFDLRKAKIGKLVGGHMPGLITIRGNPGGYHGEDEIYAETRDLELTTTRVHTTERVTFRIGPNHGHGRELQMKLTQNPQTTKRGPNIGGVESIELLHDVFMHLAAGNSGLLPGDHPNANHPSEHRLASVPPASGLTPIADNNGHLPGHAQVLAAGNPAALVPIVPRAQTIRSVPPTNQSPVEITCQGPFKYNLLETLATFQDQVNIVRPQPNGPADQGECEVLNVKFAPKPAPAEATAALDEGSATATVAALASEKSAAGEKSATTAEPAAPRHGSSNLEPRSIELLGNPAILRAPSSESFAQGQRMEYEISSGRITVEDQKEVALRQAGNEIHAQRLVYQPAEPGRLGRLVAIGPGWLKGKTPTTPNLPNGAASANAGGQIWEARWKNELRIRPNEGQQVISLLGEGQLRYGQIGFLQGNEIYFWLNEIPLTANALALPVATHDADRPLAPPATPDAFGAASGAATVAGAPRPHASADAAKTPIQLLPDKMLCRGTVLIDSPQVSGATDRLEMWFKPALPSGLSVTGGAAARGAVQPVSLEADARPPGASATAATGSASIAPLPTARFSNVPNPNLPSNLTGGNLHGEGSRPANGALSRAALNSSAPGANPGNLPANTQHFEVHGKLIRIQSLLAGQRMALDDVTIEGDARLDETQTALPSDRPMHLDGDQLQILGAAGPKTIAKVKGRPAHTEARGLGLTGELIQLDRGANRLWI
ncbi:MAG TPA: hypothetical protein VFE24_15775, partial [Pirellulales bacterium]|nr:hypothetical protein [Pirellulales bacterium]